MSFALPREDVTAGLLAAAVHGIFVLLLVFGLSWQIHDPQPIMAELWHSLPEPSRPAPPPPPEPKPAPQPEIKPQPVQDNKAAEIALEKRKLEERRKREEALALEKKRKEEKILKQKQALELERKRREEAQRKEDERRMELELEREAARLEALKREEKRLAELKRREILQREEEELQQRMLAESLAMEAARIKAKAAADQRASEVAKIVAQYKDMISAKVRGNTRLPDSLQGNPEVEFEVSVLPTGEITKLRLVKSSGNTAYDQAVQRGIEKSSPLPLPSDRTAAAEFRNLLLKHKARE